MKNIKDYFNSFQCPTETTLVGPQRTTPAPLVDHPLIYVDGGTYQRQASEGFAVGDGDSYDGRLDQKLNPKKDFNDLSYPLMFLPDTVKAVHLLGFLGARRDHEAANLGEVHALLKRHQPRTVFLDDAVIGFSAGIGDFEWDGLFSLMAFEPTQVKLTGQCAYQLTQETELKPFSSVGLSNIASGKVTVQADKPVFIFKVSTT